MKIKSQAVEWQVHRSFHGNTVRTLNNSEMRTMEQWVLLGTNHIRSLEVTLRNEPFRKITQTGENSPFDKIS